MFPPFPSSHFCTSLSIYTKLEMYGQAQIGMKRRRDMETKESDIRCAIEELSTMVVKVIVSNDSTNSEVLLDSAHIPTKPFLSVCTLVIKILDKIGPTMAVLRQDMDQNIQRLEKMHECDSCVYANIVEILKKESREGNARNTASCSRAFVWLTRSLDFTVALLQLLVEDFKRSMENAVEEAYNITLKPWHRWISSAAFKVALKLVPDNMTFINILKDKDEDIDMLKEDLQALLSLLVPLLEQIHSVLRSFRLDRLKSN